MASPTSVHPAQLYLMYVGYKDKVVCDIYALTVKLVYALHNLIQALCLYLRYDLPTYNLFLVDRMMLHYIYSLP